MQSMGLSNPIHGKDVLQALVNANALVAQSHPSDSRESPPSALEACFGGLKSGSDEEGQDREGAVCYSVDPTQCWVLTNAVPSHVRSSDAHV